MLSHMNVVDPFIFYYVFLYEIQKCIFPCVFPKIGIRAVFNLMYVLESKKTIFIVFWKFCSNFYAYFSFRTIVW